MKITKSSLRLYASANAVIANFLCLPGADRVSHVLERVKKLADAEVEKCLNEMLQDFGSRHRDFERILLTHFDFINIQYINELMNFSYQRKLLLGSFFTKEYSIQAAALFNPSMVAHPDQQGLKQGERRFVLSLRATGEGHISSIVFKTGIVDDLMNIILDSGPLYSTCLEKNEHAQYEKSFVQKRLAQFPGYRDGFLDHFPAKFTSAEAIEILKSNEFYQQNSRIALREQLYELLDSNYELQSPRGLPVNEKVIFPNSQAERMGMEDVRFVMFEDNGKTIYYGTYTAYNGKQIKTHLVETTDFDNFRIRTLYGPAIADKGMALFPEKVNGQFAMISRQGGEMINIMYSNDLYYWDNYQLLMEPKYTWELVQSGNCGSPVKTDRGWLLLIHGVGVMRTYVISAILLDLNDPSRIIGRLNKPLIQADESEREGYVPNVVYTCGLMRHNKMLVIPYAVSDSATGFVTVDLEELLEEMK